MWTRQELKEIGKTAFRAQYWKSVLVGFLLTILTAGATAASSDEGQDVTQEFEQATNGMTQQEITTLVLAGAGIVAGVSIVAILLKIFLFNPLKVGCYGFFRENVKDTTTSLDVLGTGFGRYGHTFATLFLTDLFTVLWTLLFIIPGIVKAYSYRMVPFILRDNPELSATEVITASRKMMDGQKWNAFVLDLSFIGWILLTIFTLGLVGLFWYNPYYYSTNAALYLRLKGEI